MARHGWWRWALFFRCAPLMQQPATRSNVTGMSSHVCG